MMAFPCFFLNLLLRLNYNVTGFEAAVEYRILGYYTEVGVSGWRKRAT